MLYGLTVLASELSKQHKLRNPRASDFAVKRFGKGTAVFGREIRKVDMWWIQHRADKTVTTGAFLSEDDASLAIPLVVIELQLLNPKTEADQRERLTAEFFSLVNSLAEQSEFWKDNCAHNYTTVRGYSYKPKEGSAFRTTRSGTFRSGGETPVPSTPQGVQPWGTFGPSFTKDCVTFEASAYSRESCVTVRMDMSGPIETLGSIQYVGLGPIRDIALVDADTGIFLRLQLTGRGGGGGGDDSTIGMSQEYTYEVLSPLPVTRLMAIVTFDQALGISAPSRFDVAVIPRETLPCPQLPPTTPEG